MAAVQQRSADIQTLAIEALKSYLLPTTYIIGGKQLLYTHCLAARFFIKDVAAAAAVVLVGNLIICPCLLA